MNGRENSTAGALLFALVSMGALIKGDELIGIGVGSVCAIISAILLKQSVMQAASEQEDNHQRIEIQFQQLRNKIGDGGHSNQQKATMLAITHTITDSTEAIQESLQNINYSLNELKEVSAQPVETNSDSETTAALTALSETLSATAQVTQELLKKTASNSEAQAKLVKINVEKMSDLVEKVTHVDENSKKLTELTESGQTTVQTGLKLLQVIGQMLKSPPFAKDISQLNKSITDLSEKLSALEKLEKLDKLEQLDEFTNMSSKFDEMSKNISEPLTSIAADNKTFIANTNSMTTAINQVSAVNKAVADEMSITSDKIEKVTTSVEKSTESVVAMIDAMRDEVSKLTMKIDAYNGLMKAAIEQYSTLSEQDVKVLEKIAEKVQ